MYATIYARVVHLKLSTSLREAKQLVVLQAQPTTCQAPQFQSVHVQVSTPGKREDTKCGQFSPQQVRSKMFSQKAVLISPSEEVLTSLQQPAVRR